MTLILDGTNGLSDVDGSAATPALRGSDANTGIFFPAADTIAFAEGGAEAMRISSSGFVGIGTTAPTQALTVNGQMLSIASSGASFKNITPTTGNNYMWLGNAGNNLYVGKESSAGGTLFVGGSAYAAVIGNDGAYPLQFATNNNVRATIDSSGNVLVTSAAGLGYGTGAGGTVTQATNKGTAVTLNKPTGQITTNNAALASGATVSFSINNSIITATDNIMVVVTGGSSYTVQPAFVSGGVANIRLTNTTGGSLSEAVVINFAVIKGATS